MKTILYSYQEYEDIYFYKAEIPKTKLELAKKIIKFCGYDFLSFGDTNKGIKKPIERLLKEQSTNILSVNEEYYREKWENIRKIEETSDYSTAVSCGVLPIYGNWDEYIKYSLDEAKELIKSYLREDLCF